MCDLAGSATRKLPRPSACDLYGRLRLAGHGGRSRTDAVADRSRAGGSRAGCLLVSKPRSAGFATDLGLPRYLPSIRRPRPVAWRARSAGQAYALEHLAKRMIDMDGCVEALMMD